MNGINWSIVLPQLEGMKDADVEVLFMGAVKEARKEAKKAAERAASFDKRAVEALHHVFQAYGKDIMARGVALTHAIVKLDTPMAEHSAAVELLSTHLESSGQRVFGVVAGPQGGLVRLFDSNGKPTALAAILAKEGTLVRFGKVTRNRKSSNMVQA